MEPITSSTVDDLLAKPFHLTVAISVVNNYIHICITASNMASNGIFNVIILIITIVLIIMRIIQFECIHAYCEV